MFGPQLSLDLYNCNKKKLGDVKFIKNFLNKLPEIIRMHKISKPFVKFYPGKKESFDKGGISGFILIAESHIAIHTFIPQKSAFLDIFSCKNFDENSVIKFSKEEFEAKKIEKNFLMRGKWFKK